MMSGSSDRWAELKNETGFGTYSGDIKSNDLDIPIYASTSYNSSSRCIDDLSATGQLIETYSVFGVDLGIHSTEILK